ncbi:MAG: hypothetical protein R6U13_02445 [Desulfatiglandaceae bacterium]
MALDLGSPTLRSDASYLLSGFLVVMMVNPQSKADFKILFALTVVRFTGDYYTSFMTPPVLLFTARNAHLASVR